MPGTDLCKTIRAGLFQPKPGQGEDLDAWEKQVLGFLPPWMAFDFRLMYAFFQDRGLQAAPSDIERLQKLLGRSPRKFEDFAVETAGKWRG